MRGLTLFILFLSSTAASGAEVRKLMQDLAWDYRVLIIFSNGEPNTRLNQQNTMLASGTDGLKDRDMVIIRVSDDVTIDEQAHAASASSFQQRFAVRPKTFRAILVGKDGTVKLDQSEPVTTQRLFTLIDAMPMRQYEILQNDD